MLRQNRSIQTQYDAMMELRSIDALRESLHRRVQVHHGREKSRQTQPDAGSSDESYVPTGLEEEVCPPEEDNRIAGFEYEDQYLQTRATAFTRRLNSRLKDIREQEGVIEAICRDAYRPTVLARLFPGEPLDGGATSRGSVGNVSRVEYTGPTRSSGLTCTVTRVLWNLRDARRGSQTRRRR